MKEKKSELQIRRTNPIWQRVVQSKRWEIIVETDGNWGGKKERKLWIRDNEIAAYMQKCRTIAGHRISGHAIGVETVLRLPKYGD